MRNEDLAQSPHHTELYIVSNDLTKIEAVKTMFATIYPATPVLVGAGR